MLHKIAWMISTFFSLRVVEEVSDKYFYNPSEISFGDNVHVIYGCWFCRIRDSV